MGGDLGEKSRAAVDRGMLSRGLSLRKKTKPSDVYRTSCRETVRHSGQVQVRDE